MNNLGQYYTENVFSDLLVKNISASSPTTVIDLGIGEGSLTRSAHQRWGNISFYAADIDIKNVLAVTKLLPFVNIIKASGLNKNVSNKLQLTVGSVDVAVCNPPYLKVKNQQQYNKLFIEASMKPCIDIKILTSEVIFLAQNLRLLKKHGELGIILPDSIVTGYDFEKIRKSIIAEHRLKAVIELPEKIFPKTEAKTHILFIQKGSSTSESVSLYIANKSGQCYDMINISPESLVKRLDYSYHKWEKSLKRKTKVLTLGELGCNIQRGTYSHNYLKEKTDIYLHTTEMIHKKALKIKSDTCKGESPNAIYAEEGDILLARVGRGCIGKVSIIKKGKLLISDCIYRIRVPQEHRKLIWKSLISVEGQKWFNANAHGVCAKVISKRDLLNYPVKIN